MNNEQPATDKPTTPPTILRCLVGAIISGAIAVALYLVTNGIAQTFATKPLQTDNVTAINISIAVRTLIVGLSTLGAGIFGLTALGLLALAVQILIQRLTQQTSPPSSPT